MGAVYPMPQRDRARSRFCCKCAVPGLPGIRDEAPMWAPAVAGRPLFRLGLMLTASSLAMGRR
jgi:hypothetical protein